MNIIIKTYSSYVPRGIYGANFDWSYIYESLLTQLLITVFIIGARIRWSQEDSDTVAREMKQYLKDRVYPTTAELEKLRSRYSFCAMRTVAQIKSHLQYLMKHQ